MTTSTAARAGGRAWLGNLLAAALSLGFCLAVLEVAARTARSHKGGKEQRERILYAEHDPLLGWRKRPGARVVYDRRDYTVEVTINSRGLRDPERDYQPAPEVARVLALGDSFVEAFMVPLEKTVTQRLEARLTGPRCKTEVVNGGTSGYSTDQEYLFYREEGWRYEAKLVALFFYYNDVVFNAQDGGRQLPKPLLAFDGPRPEPVNFPVPRREPPRPAADARPGRRGSAALEWLGDRLERSFPRAYNALSATGLWPPLRQLPISAEFRVYMRNLPPEVQQGWRATENILQALSLETARHDARLLVVYVPSRMEVNDDDWTLTQLRYGLAPGKWDRGRVMGRLGDICARLRIPVLDLTPSLRGAARGLGGGPYFATDSHWNAKGQDVAAGELAAFLQRQGWVRDCSGSAAARPGSRDPSTEARPPARGTAPPVDQR